MENIQNKISEVKDKYYQITYDNEKNKVDKRCVSFGKTMPDILIILRFRFNKYLVLCVQYTLEPKDMKNDDLKMIGLLFTQNGKTYYSLDMVNKNGTDDIYIKLSRYGRDGKLRNTQVIEKVEKNPDEKKVVEYLIEFLSHTNVKKIFV